MIHCVDNYTKALMFAAKAHGFQSIPGTRISYVAHLANVAMEVFAASVQDSFDTEFAMTCAYLHDTIEDTDIQEESIAQVFGPEVLLAVHALSKKKELPKEEQMLDSIQRILQQRKEVAIVKLADRIANLYSPPEFWSLEKRRRYQTEASLILQHLGFACKPLADRLAQKIKDYQVYLEVR